MGPDKFIRFDDLSDENKANVSQNIIAVQLLIAELTDSTLDHIRQNGDGCILSCIGVPATEMIDNFGSTELKMILTIAIRQLAQQQLGQEASP